MRRILLTLAKLLAVIAAAFLLCGSARAEGSGEYGDINSALSDAVPPEASEILEGGGITPRQQRCGGSVVRRSAGVPAGHADGQAH